MTKNNMSTKIHTNNGLVVRRQKAIAGFLPTTYAVFWGEKVVKIFLDKKEAVAFCDHPVC